MGGHGVTGSADSLQVGVTLGYPSGRAGPLDRERTSAADILATAGDAAMLVTGSSEQSSSRQPPTVTADTTAAAIGPTHDSRPTFTPADTSRDLVTLTFDLLSLSRCHTWRVT